MKLIVERTGEEFEFPDPECPSGYPWTQIERILHRDTFKDFEKWMSGQTMTICEGRKYNHDLRRYEPDECADNPHDGVVYKYDLHRFLGLLGRYHQNLWD